MGVGISGDMVLYHPRNLTEFEVVKRAREVKPNFELRLSKQRD
jgi:hypothetical protein